MTEATSSGFYERQRLDELKIKLLRLAGPEDARGLAWFKPTIEQGRDERRRPW